MNDNNPLKLGWKKRMIIGTVIGFVLGFSLNVYQINSSSSDINHIYYWINLPWMYAMERLLYFSNNPDQWLGIFAIMCPLWCTFIGAVIGALYGWVVGNAKETGQTQ